MVKKTVFACMKLFRWPFAVLGPLLLLSFIRANRHPLIIRFQNEVGNRPLSLSTESYTNRFGESFTIRQFKYYVSNIQIIGKDGEQLLLDEPHLVDQGDSSSLILHLSSNISGIQSIRFAVGVDSLANVSGVQTGDLDPMLGMFWTWNTGYINARLEGESDSAHAPAHRFTWDIGGYKGNRNTFRFITLALPERSLPEHNEQSRDSLLCIRADLLQWFDGSRPIRITQAPICHEPGPLAMQIADNYSTMFSVCR